MKVQYSCCFYVTCFDIIVCDAGKHEKPRWNEKFIFDLSEFDCKNSTYLKCRIMDTELFRNGGFVGEAK